MHKKTIILVGLNIAGLDFTKRIDGGVSADNTQHQEQPSGAEKIVRVLAERGYECSHDQARQMWVSFSRNKFHRDWENISFNTVPRYSDDEIFGNVRPFFQEAQNQ